MRTRADPDAPPVLLDGFEVLDACHRDTVLALGRLAELARRLDGNEPDEQVRRLAREIVDFFSTTSYEHHQDEERHIFPKLALTGDAAMVQAVERLRQDHGWLQQDWLELQPQLDAIASGQSWVDLDMLREGVEIFTALSQDHVTLEESLIYPEARGRLQQEERHAMGREMAARRRARDDR